VEWYAHGRPATREEVLHSIETGIGILEEQAASEKGGMEALQQARQVFEVWLPAEVKAA
jgi:hypothetical protein